MPDSPAASSSAPLSVSELTGGLSALVEDAYSDIWVEGELSNFKRAASGHCYFTLKDADAQIRCVMWRHLTKYIFFQPQDGLQVRVHGDASVYERRGDLQILARAMREAGKGAMQDAFERLKQTLKDEGLFEDARKKPLPAFPSAIGVVTSGTGAAVQDILSVLERRFPIARVMLCPVPVQGPDAPDAIARAIAAFNAQPAPPDVLIVGRGGGSAEDLWAFNEEVVARTIAASDVPIISAVGHETDVSIADFVADERAATPSMAAEIAVPDQRDLTERIRTLVSQLEERTRGTIRAARQRVEHLTATRAFHAPVHRLRAHQQTLDALVDRLHRSGRRAVEQQRNRLLRLRDRLRAADPEAPLRRGYALIDAKGAAVRSASALAPDDAITLRFIDGTRHARITASAVEASTEASSTTDAP